MEIEDEKQGVERVREALESKFWPNMIKTKKQVSS